MKIMLGDLRAALEVLKNVPTRSGIASSEYIEVQQDGDNLVLRCAADMFGVATVPLQEPFIKLKYYLDRKLLGTFVGLNHGTKSPLVVEYKDDALVFKAGRRTARFTKVTPISGYSVAPKLKAEQQVTALGKVVAELQLAANYAAKDSLFPEMSCVHVLDKERLILASDKYSVFSTQLPKRAGFNYALPQTLPALLTDKTSLFVAPAGVRMSFERGYTFQAYNSKALADFPTQAVMKATKTAAAWKEQFRLPVNRLTDLLVRLKSFTGSGGDDGTVKATKKEGDARIRFRIESTQGRFEESLKYHTAAGEFSAEWLLPSLLPFLEASRGLGDVIGRWEGSSAYCFSLTDSKRILLAPRRDGGK